MSGIMELVVHFSGPLWEYQGEAPWVFVTLPVDAADRIRERFPAPGGFGTIKVEVELGESRWQTSLFPDKASGSFLLPIKRAIRDREGLAIGEAVEVSVGLK
ncbi:MAG: DUF1905 domain-containing protein [Acidimicrobiia bacterium]